MAASGRPAHSLVVASVITSLGSSTSAYAFVSRQYPADPLLTPRATTRIEQATKRRVVLGGSTRRRCGPRVADCNLCYSNDEHQRRIECSRDYLKRTNLALVCTRWNRADCVEGHMSASWASLPDIREFPATILPITTAVENHAAVSSGGSEEVVAPSRSEEVRTRPPIQQRVENTAPMSHSFASSAVRWPFIAGHHPL